MSPGVFWLVCWSLGGLIAMSLIPSKRVDRIFPVIPPLCLLLAAQIGSCLPCGHGGLAKAFGAVSRHQAGVDTDLTGHMPMATGNGSTRIYVWGTISLVFAIFFTGGYATWKVVSGYRDHRNALAIFGRDIRREAAARHWRYEVVSAKDEGLLLYLQKTHYIEPDQAVTDWNAGNLDALVASTEKAANLMPQLRGATVSELKPNERKKGQGMDYVFITR